MHVQDEDGSESKGAGAVDLEALSMTLAEVAAAMAYLHAHRITHRDLKPKNILLRTSDKDRRGFVAKVRCVVMQRCIDDMCHNQGSEPRLKTESIIIESLFLSAVILLSGRCDAKMVVNIRVSEIRTRRLALLKYEGML
jgi:serine/threonine protein kinase